MSSPSDVEPAITQVAYSTQCTSRQQRFVSSMVVLKEIASYIAGQPAAEFGTLMECLRGVRDCLYAGDSDVLLESVRQQPTADAGGSSPASASPALEDTLVSVAVSFASEAADALVSTELTPSASLASEDSSVDRNSAEADVVSAAPEAAVSATVVGGDGAATEVIFRPVPKARGRPAKARQRPFKVLGKKATSNAAPDDNSNCVECGMVDPPRAVCRKQQVDWVLCDTCEYWYHVCCTGRKAPKGKFVCTRCK